MQLLENFLSVAAEAAQKAGHHIISSRSSVDIIVSEKRRNDLVTQFDIESEKIITSHITSHFPDHGILAEEGMLNKNGSTNYLWIIDPIDGTENFANGIDHFAISIALKREETTIVGVVFNPVSREMFTSIRNKGSFLNGKRIYIREFNSIEKSIVLTNFPSKINAWKEVYVECFRDMLTECQNLKSFGAASLDIAYVASGKADGFFEFDLKLWDIAAAELLIKEAGGHVTDCLGEQGFPEKGFIAGTDKICNNIKNVISNYTRCIFR
jgi:myo-inositol-1(or 4)-monophosphatase